MIDKTTLTGRNEEKLLQWPLLSKFIFIVVDTRALILKLLTVTAGLGASSVANANIGADKSLVMKIWELLSRNRIRSACDVSWRYHWAPKTWKSTKPGFACNFTRKNKFLRISDPMKHLHFSSHSDRVGIKFRPTQP